jgi:cell division protein FtsB
VLEKEIASLKAENENLKKQISTLQSKILAAQKALQ